MDQMVRNGDHKCSNKIVAVVDEKTIGEDENSKKSNSFKLSAESPRVARAHSHLAPVHEEVSPVGFVDEYHLLLITYFVSQKADIKVSK